MEKLGGFAQLAKREALIQDAKKYLANQWDLTIEELQRLSSDDLLAAILKSEPDAWIAISEYRDRYLKL